jgi:hypothetical protein
MNKQADRKGNWVQRRSFLAFNSTSERYGCGQHLYPRLTEGELR